MHIPRKFEQNDQVKLKELINSYPFATLVTSAEAGLEANHIPFLLTQSKGKDVLQGHIAKANPLWKNTKDKSEVLVIFNGPNCYVSPNFYPTKKETGKAVPTWNYVVVHVRGVISYIHDEKLNLSMMSDLTNRHEAGQPTPWSISDAPEDYIHKMMPAIVGIEVEVSSISGQWKLSQNHPENNRQGVVDGLSNGSDGDSRKIAELVKYYSIEARLNEVGS